MGKAIVISDKNGESTGEANVCFAADGNVCFDLESDGLFVLELPAGPTKFYGLSTSDHNVKINESLEFTTQPGTINYVGDYKVEWKNMHTFRMFRVFALVGALIDVLAGNLDSATYEVIDNSAATLQALQRKIGDSNSEYKVVSHITTIKRAIASQQDHEK